MTLQNIFDIATEFAANMFRENGEVRPIYICETHDGRHLPFLVPTPRDREDKELIVRSMHVMFRLHNVDRYVFMSEGYQLLLSDADENTDYSQYDCKLAEHPDSVEVISFFAEDRTGESMSGYYRILRPEHGRARLATLKVSPRDTRSIGRTTGLLQD